MINFENYFEDKEKAKLKIMIENKELILNGDTEGISFNGNVVIYGDVASRFSCDGNVYITGNVDGTIIADGSVNIQGTYSGLAKTENYITVNGESII